ncbi:PTS sorbose transporter subunit IIA, partial [Escherichia coli]
DNQVRMNVDELCEHLTQIAKQSCVVWRQVATAEEYF